jgi:hypothetical protein
MANFFLSASNSRSLYDRRSEELIISYVKKEILNSDGQQFHKHQQNK